MATTAEGYGERAPADGHDAQRVPLAVADPHLGAVRQRHVHPLVRHGQSRQPLAGHALAEVGGRPGGEVDRHQRAAESGAAGGGEGVRLPPVGRHCEAAQRPGDGARALHLEPLRVESHQPPALGGVELLVDVRRRPCWARRPGYDGVQPLGRGGRAGRAGPPAAYGVWLVELAPLADGVLVPRAALAAVGGPEVPDRSPLVALLAHLRPRAEFATLSVAAALRRAQ